MDNYDFEVPFTWDRLQDKFQLSSLVRFFEQLNLALKWPKEEAGEYFYNPSPVGMAHGYLLRSGNKILCDYIIHMPDPDDTNTNDAIHQIWQIVQASYLRKWEQLRDALYTDYKVLEPTDYHEERSLERTDEMSGTESKLSSSTTNDVGQKGGTESKTDAFTHGEEITHTNLKAYGKTTETDTRGDHSITETAGKTGNPNEVTTRSGAVENDQGHYGFNAQVVSPVNSSDVSSTETTIRTGDSTEASTRVNAGLDSINETTRNTGADTESGTDTHTGTDTVTSAIAHNASDSRISDKSESSSGAKSERANGTETASTSRTGRFMETPQKLIQQEWKAREKTLMEQIFVDLDSLLCIKLY